MFDGKYFDTGDRDSVNDPIRPFKDFPHFIVDESL